MIGFFKGVLIFLNILSVFYLVAFFTAEFITWCRGDKYEDEVYDGFMLPKNRTAVIILAVLALSVITFTFIAWEYLFR